MLNEARGRSHELDVKAKTEANSLTPRPRSRPDAKEK